MEGHVLIVGTGQAGPRDQMGLCEGPTAAECNQTQLLHIRGHENNSKGGERAR